MRAKPLVALTITMVATLAALAAAHPWLLARYWDERLERAGDAEAIQELRMAHAVGASAADMLARAAGDSRSDLAAIARSAIVEQIDAARLEPTATAAGRLKRLAAALAEQSCHWSDAARADNAVLATRILSLAGQHFPAEEREAIVAHCEAVLRAAYQREAEVAEHAGSLGKKIVAKSQARSASETEQRAIATASFDAPLAQYPGGGLPIDQAGPSVAEMKHSLLPSPSAATDASAKRITENGPMPASASRRPDPSEPPQLTDDDTLKPLPLTAPSAQLLELPRFTGAPSRKVSVGATAAAIAVRDASQAAARPTSPVIEMAERLHSPVDSTQAGARAELRAIGYSDAHIDLLRSVTDSDAEKRAAAARALPVMRGMDALPWLLWLSFDDVEEVRHAALSVLATSNDPALADRMRLAANSDAAPRVRRLAETYLANLSARRH